MTPPTAINRDYPPTLELIVMRALEKRPEDRYQSAEEMSHDLEEFLEESGLRSGNRRMALYMQELFAPDAATSDAGVAASRSFAERGRSRRASATCDDDSEELDLDRRAPLAMRIEVAPEPAAPRRGARQLGRVGAIGARRPDRGGRAVAVGSCSAGRGPGRAPRAITEPTQAAAKPSRAASWVIIAVLHRDRRRGDGNHDAEMISSSARCERPHRAVKWNEIRLRSLPDQVLHRGRKGSREGPQGQM